MLVFTARVAAKWRCRDGALEMAEPPVDHRPRPSSSAGLEAPSDQPADHNEADRAVAGVSDQSTGGVGVAKPRRQSPAEMLAEITDDADASLSAAVEEAMRAVSSEEISDPKAPIATGEDPKPNDLVIGRIANIGSEDVLLDFGAKMLGVMPRADLDGEDHLKLGDSLEVLVIGEQGHGGLLAVSRKRAKQEVILRDLAVGIVLEGPVTGMNRGGLEVDIHGLRAFIPASHVDTKFLKDISNLIGQTIRAEVTKFDRDDRNIVLSRRKVLAREEKLLRDQTITTLEAGQVLRGKVENITDYGAFVNIGGVDGLLHVSDMSWGRVRKPTDVVQIGDEIEVKILAVDREKKKVSLGLKQVLPDPWEKAGEKYTNGTRVSGRVVRLANFGAFVELEPGVDALLPISEMSWTRRVNHPKEIVKTGDVIEAAIVGSDPAQRKISLSLKALAEDPWACVALRYPPGSLVKGKIVRTTDFGAFVNLEEGVDGLIHISELSDKHVRAVADVAKVGEEIEARVLSVDPEARKIGLSLRPAPVEPTPEQLAAARAEAERAARLRPRPKKRRGGITFGWDEGLSALDPSKFAR